MSIKVKKKPRKLFIPFPIKPVKSLIISDQGTVRKLVNSHK